MDLADFGMLLEGRAGDLAQESLGLAALLVVILTALFLPALA